MIGEIFGRLLGTDKAVGKLVDSVSSGLDKLHYGAQEKAEDNARSVTEGRMMVIEWLKNTQGQNLARRVIALSIVFFWLFLYACMVLSNFLAVWWIERAEQLAASAVMMGGYAKDMNTPVMLILGFYFAAPHLGKFISGRNASGT